MSLLTFECYRRVCWKYSSRSGNGTVIGYRVSDSGRTPFLPVRHTENRNPKLGANGRPLLSAANRELVAAYFRGESNGVVHEARSGCDLLPASSILEG